MILRSMWEKGVVYSELSLKKRGGEMINASFFVSATFWGATVDGRNPANQLRLVVYPVIHKVL